MARAKERKANCRMEATMPRTRKLAKIDSAIDRVMEDEEKARELKKAVREVLSDSEEAEAEEGEELWDDVPV